MYIYQPNGDTIIVTGCVDDFLIIVDNIDVTGIMKRKRMEMGDVSLFLGMQVTRDHQNGTLTISTENSTKSVLDRFGLVGCNPASSPGYSPELSTKQPEETLLNEKETQRYQVISGTAVHHRWCKKAM